MKPEMQWEKVPRVSGSLYIDGAWGRYLVRRVGKSSRTFRAWLNNKPTNMYGTAPEVQAKVERAIRVNFPHVLNVRDVTPWDNPDLFERLTLGEVVERKRRGLSTSSCNLWDGNVQWESKTIDPWPSSASATTVNCLYSGVCLRAYKLSRVVFLRIEEKQR